MNLDYYLNLCFITFANKKTKYYIFDKEIFVQFVKAEGLNIQLLVQESSSVEFFCSHAFGLYTVK